MTLRATVALIIGGFLIALLGLYVYRFIPRLQLNRAIYALNQGQYADAEARLKRLATREPVSDRTSLPLAEALIRQRRYAEGLHLLQASNHDEEARFWRGVAAYELGDEPTAREQMALYDIAENSDATRRVLARVAYAALETTDVPGVIEELPARAGKLEQMLYSSWGGRVAMSSANWAKAAELFQAALANGDRNPGTPALASCAYVLSNDFARGQYFIDAASSPTARLLETSRTLAGLLDDQQTSTVVEQQLAQQFRLERSWLRCEAWLELQAFRHDLPSAHQNGTPSDDPVATLLQCELQGLNGDARSAFVGYERVYSEYPNLKALVRQLDAAGMQQDLLMRVAEFAESLPDAHFIPASETTSTQKLGRLGEVLFRDAGTLSALLQAKSTASHRVHIIAASDHASSTGPVLGVRIGTIACPLVYVASEGWDCYAVDCELSAGEHLITLDYSTQADTELNEGENRSLYVLGFLVEQVRPGGN